jgi:hypothetical protein
MKLRIFVFAYLFILLMALGAPVKAQTPVADEVKSVVVDSITSRWNDWETASISGKFRMAGLPLSPSVKIYMERDSSVFISLRAPLMGEVGRAEITDSAILVVNKMNKTYVEESLDKALAYYPGGISDIQDLLLGRIPIAGFGTLSHEIERVVDVYAEEDGTATLVVNGEAEIPGFNYGFVIDSGFFPAALMVIPEAHPDVAVTLTYEYFVNGYDLTFTYQSEKRNYRGTLELDPPDWTGGSFDPIKLNSKYTRLDFDKFMKSF